MKLPNKGDLREYKNYREISVLSTPGEVLDRVILERLRGTIDVTSKQDSDRFRVQTR